MVEHLTRELLIKYIIEQECGNRFDPCYYTVADFSHIYEQVRRFHGPTTEKYFPQGMIPPVELAHGPVGAGFCIRYINSLTKGMDEKQLRTHLNYWITRMKIRNNTEKLLGEILDEQMLESIVEQEMG